MGIFDYKNNANPQKSGLLNSFQQAEANWPRFKEANLAYTKSPNDGSGRKIEAWDKGDKGGFEMGGEARYRPESLPLNQRGIEDFGDNTPPLDLYGDLVSHYSVNEEGSDLRKKYLDFTGNVPMETMQKRYSHAQKDYGEDRPFDVWNNRSGMPEYFRGYTFNQWPNAEEMYRPEDIEKLDSIKGLLGITGN